MSKKLTATMVTQLVNALIVWLVAYFHLEVPSEVQIAFITATNGVLLWYLHKQGVIDLAKECKEPENITGSPNASVHDEDDADNSMQFKKRGTNA